MVNEVPTLWPHQSQCIERAKILPFYSLHFSMGTGKSRTAIEIIKHRFNSNKRIMRTLMFTPPIVIETLRGEWFKYSKIDKKEVIALTGSAVQRLKTFMQHAFNEQGQAVGKVFVTNYEAIRMPELYEAFKKWQVEIYVMDEHHRVKNPSSKTAKLLDELTNKHSKPSLRLGLTGTPIVNSLLDLFMPTKIIAGGFPTEDGRLITSFFMFRTLFFEDANSRWKGQQNYFPNWQAKPSTQEAFSRILSSFSMSVKKEDCLSLPPEVNITVPVPLTKQQREDYDRFERDMVLNIEGKNYTADIALTKALRLSQICSGFISGLDQPDGSESQPIKYAYPDTERETALRYLLQEICVENGEKTIVWATWSQNYETIARICDELKIKYVSCNGTVSAKGKEAARKAFTEDPTVKVWLAHPMSGGIGVSLVVAHFAIWFSRNFSLEAFEQANSRSHRAGQTHTVTNYHLVAKDTIELDVLDALQNKRNIAELILNKTNLYKEK